MNAVNRIDTFNLQLLAAVANCPEAQDLLSQNKDSYKNVSLPIYFGVWRVVSSSGDTKNSILFEPQDIGVPSFEPKRKISKKRSSITHSHHKRPFLLMDKMWRIWKGMVY